MWSLWANGQQGEVQDVLQKAPHLEKLVDMYAGENRMTAREQSQRLQSVADTMPDHVAPEIKDFMQRAMLTLQVFVSPKPPSLSQIRAWKCIPTILLGKPK
jgi:hypothetical protein